MRKLLIATFLTFNLFFIITSANSLTKHTELKIYNPYSVSVKMLVKCDYYKNKYKFLKTYKLKKKSNITIKIPLNMKKCEVWPTDVGFF